MTDKKNKYQFNLPMLTAVVIFILLAITIALYPGIKARYLSSDDSKDEARVAKWKIDSIDANGVNLDKTIDFNQKITTESGYYFFEIHNASETLALLENDSKITIELKHETFIGMNKNPLWDFLSDSNGSIVDNPIDFEAVFYNTAIENVISIDGEGNISLKELSSEINDTKLFTTKDCIKNLMYKTGSAIPTYCLTFEFEEANVANNDRLMQIGEENKITIGLFWHVNATGGSGGGSGSSDIESLKYTLYDLVSIIPSGFNVVDDTVKTGYSVKDPNGDTKNYYIVEKKVNFADYFIVSAGEPTFTFSNDKGGEIQVSYTEVLNNNDRKTELLNRTIPDANPTYDDLMNYIEKLEFSQFSTFNIDRENFIKAQSYMQYGLTIDVIFDLKVAQVD